MCLSTFGKSLYLIVFLCSIFSYLPCSFIAGCCCFTPPPSLNVSPPSHTLLPCRRCNPPSVSSLCTIGGDLKQTKKKKEKKQQQQVVTSEDVRPRCLLACRSPAATHLPTDPHSAFLPLPEGGQSGVGEGEETASAWRAAQPTAHQTHPHILSVSRRARIQRFSVTRLIQI